MDTPWRIQLFGQLRAQQGQTVVTRFRTLKAGALLARLALFPQRAHPRDELIELFWPDTDLDAGRNSLRVTLNSLRRQLEPPEVPPGAVLQADRFSIQLNREAFSTDVADYKAALAHAGRADGIHEKIAHLVRAAGLYSGGLLPGFYDEWIEAERTHLAEEHLGGLRRLVRLLSQAQDWSRAIGYARQALSLDPLREDLHEDLMRLYAAAGQFSLVRSHWEETVRLFEATLGEPPSPDLQQQSERLAEPTQETVAAPPDAPASPAPAPLPAKAAPAPPPASRRGGLPLQFTRFFDRQDEIRRLRTWLQPAAGAGGETRLVTLTGPGGVGKTRLAVEAAGQLREAFQDRVWFVPLADLTDFRRLPDVIAGVLRPPHTAGKDAEPLEEAIELLSQQPSLLVLDNMEHLAADGSTVVLTLCRRVPSLVCLITSRRSLGLPGEQEIAVPPLPTPSGAHTSQELAQVASVQMFVDRAQAVRPDFQVTARNAADMAALCERLEGIPLAIELAAARSRVLSPAQIREHLAHRFTLLVNQRADKDARHGSLRATLEGSYQLLSPAEQRFFSGVSVFVGGWTLEAAQSVCQEPAALDVLEQLRTDSLVTAEENAHGMRFRMLETLREFAQEQVTPDERESLSHRHAEYFLALAEEAEPEIKGRRQAQWLDRLELEQDNFRAALAWYLVHEHDRGLRLAGALGLFWYVRGYLTEGRSWLAQALVQEDSASATRARALNRAGSLAFGQGDLAAARALYEGSLALQRALEDDLGIANALGNLAIVAQLQGDYPAARALYEESLGRQRELGNTLGIANTLGNLAVVLREQGDRETARWLHEESLALHRRMGNRLDIANALDNLGIVRREQGDLAAARVLHEEGLALHRQLGDAMGVANALGNLGNVALRQGDYAQARLDFGECLRECWETGDKRLAAFTLEGLSRLAQAQQRPKSAARLAGAAQALRQAIGSPLPLNEREEWEREVQAMRAALGDRAWRRAWEAGAALTPDQAIEQGLAEARSE